MADKYLNETGLAYYHGRIKNLFADKGEFETVSGKVEALEEAGGEANVIETVKLNGTALAVTDKAVDVSISTGDVTGIETYVQNMINASIADITGIDFEIVAELPSTGEKGVIYLVSNSGSGRNIYDEYIYVGAAFEKIGSTDVDLSGYWSTSDLAAITTAEIDSVISGSGS